MNLDDPSPRPTPYGPPPPQVTERIIVAAAPQRSRLSMIVSLLFFVFLVLPGILVALMLVGAVASVTGGVDKTVDEHYHSLSKTAKDKIAIITVDGAIIDGEGFIKKQIDHVRDDKEVRAVVLRVNSPGGTVTASDYLYHHLRKMLAERKIPMVVSMGGIAASGGYYIAMAVGDGEKVIFAEPTTWTGSIGVIIPHYNVAGLMKTWDVEEDSIKSGPLKQMGTPTRPMTDEERAIFQHLVDDSFQRFQDIVKAGRPALAKDPDALAKVTTGQVFTTGEAISKGLVDEEGYIEEAIDRAAKLSGLSRDNLRAVKYKTRGGLMGLPFATESRSSLDLAALVDLASPRAYFLCTWQLPFATQAK
ncbi:MAG TPA: signal peptide peptidase SppA [Pirellulales bacterium]|jgi:protease-4